MRQLFTFLLLVVMMSCANKNDQLPQSVKGPAVNNEIKLSPEKPKYPAALVFEGGTGNWAAPDSSARKPYWRLHICLSETENETSGEVKINLKELNTVYKQRGTIGDKPYLQHLNEVSLKYTYVAHFHKYNDNFSYGLAAVNSKSTQTWLQVAGPQKDPRDLEIFNPNFGLNDLGNFNITGYQEEDGTEMYLGYSYQRVVLEHPKIQACEKANSPYVLEILKK